MKIQSFWSKKMKYLVSVSGGKDSTATLLWILEGRQKEYIIPIFCDTGWEMDETYEYLDYLENRLEIKIHRTNRNFFEKYRFTYNHKGYFEYIVQPIVNWTTQQVFDYF